MEYEKTIKTYFTPKNGVLAYANYEEIMIPHRATRGSAGYDFFSPISFKLKPGQCMKIPTGIKCSLNQGNFLALFPRSSYGFQYFMQLDDTVGIIDQDYYNNESNEGHIFIQITNGDKNGKVLNINKGEAFAQGIILSFLLTENDNATVQRTGGSGSTSNNGGNREV